MQQLLFYKQNETLLNDICKGQFWLEPKTEMDLGPKNPNNKFVESGRKN